MAHCQRSTAASRGRCLKPVSPAPGAGSSPNSHPGLETGYILEGEVVISIAGEPDLTMKAGDSYTITAGSVHSVRTVGDKPSKIIATYVVERGKPLSTPAQ